MTYIYKMIGLLAVATLLSGCGDGSNNLESINGISVPPEPDETENNATLAGVDSNSNGIRDDVERTIAQDFGKDPKKYDQTINLAIYEQAILTNPTEEVKQAYIQTVKCDDLTSSESNRITNKIINTDERSDAYIRALSGVVIRGGKSTCSEK